MEWSQGASGMAHLRALLPLALSVAARPGKLGGHQQPGTRRPQAGGNRPIIEYNP
jgi:hypothetical protein